MIKQFDAKFVDTTEEGGAR